MNVPDTPMVDAPVSIVPRQEAFLSRWSRLKREVADGAVPPGTLAEPPAATLPSLETLTAQGLEGDFSAFMQSEVEEGVRRLAIQQLFKQPVFNVMDGLDVYIDDYSVFEPIAASELSGLSHARSILFPDEQAAQIDSTTEVVATAMTETPLEEIPHEQ